MSWAIIVPLKTSMLRDSHAAFPATDEGLLALTLCVCVRVCVCVRACVRAC